MVDDTYSGIRSEIIESVQPRTRTPKKSSQKFPVTRTCIQPPPHEYGAGNRRGDGRGPFREHPALPISSVPAVRDISITSDITSEA